MQPQVFNTPLRVVWNVLNNATEALWWPAGAQQSSLTKTVLLFICGNPGLVEYYTDFLQYIYEETPTSSLEIVGVSHLGHSLGAHTTQSPSNRVYSLQEQIDHKLACFDRLRKENTPDTQYILMGHSVGSYICAEVLKQRQHHNIKQLIALFPTLREIALTPNGVNITRLVSTVPLSLISGLAGLVSWIPAPVRQAVTGLITGQKNQCLQVTAHGLLHRSVIQNVLHMAKQEMETIKELDHDFYMTHVDKFIMYYSRNDEWAPLDHYEYMTQKFPFANVHLCAENIPHAFILDDRHSKYMANKVIEWISAQQTEEKN